MGHPEVYVGADCPPDCVDREGIIKCKGLPPRGLYHPFLPYKSNSKLMFPLYSSCADTMNQDDCTHSEERCIVGTWVVDEVRKAVEMGYDLMDVNEFWEYEVTCFVKACYFIFPKFIHVLYIITHFYGLADLIHYPCPDYAALLIRVCTVVLVHSVGTS